MSRMSAILLLLGLPAQAVAQGSDILIRFTAPAEIGAADVANTVIVVNQDARIDGVVARNLLVVNGTARIRGEVRGAITAVNGVVVLEPTAVVGTDVVLYRSTVTQEQGATVVGRVVNEQVPSFAQFAWVIWLGATLVVLVSGLIFTFLGRAQLQSAVQLLRERPGPAVLAALAVVVGIPAAAFLAVVTGVGVPLAFVLLFFALPVVAFLGYLVAGTTLGAVLARRAPGLAANPYATAAVGLLSLQLLVAIPAFGPLLAIAATQVGAGALAYRLYVQHRGGARAA